LIWPEDGFASIALPQRRSPTSFPCRLRRHSSRIKQVGASPSSAALRLEVECGVDRSRPVDRHRGRDGRGLETEIRGEIIMANIGSFKKVNAELGHAQRSVLFAK
jgi:hypothetical protein